MSKVVTTILTSKKKSYETHKECVSNVQSNHYFFPQQDDNLNGKGGKGQPKRTPRPKSIVSPLRSDKEGYEGQNSPKAKINSRYSFFPSHWALKCQMSKMRCYQEIFIALKTHISCSNKTYFSFTPCACAHMYSQVKLYISFKWTYAHTQTHTHTYTTQTG